MKKRVKERVEWWSLFFGSSGGKRKQRREVAKGREKKEFEFGCLIGEEPSLSLVKKRRLSRVGKRKLISLVGNPSTSRVFPFWFSLV